MMKYLICLLLSLNLALASNEEALQQFAEANNLFASSVYKEMTKSNKENFLVSPYSVETVLAFAHSGCKGNSAQEIRKSLHLSDDKDKVEAGVKASFPLLTGNDLYTLHTANKMYAKENFAINEEFKKAAVEVYNADIETINFAKKTEAADTMNKWVEEKTNHKIKNLINPDILNELTTTILINALYFKANWTNQFIKGSTSKQAFYKSVESTADVDMMHQYRERYNYFESPELQAKFLELPFEGDENISMVFVLPNEKDGLKALENQIDKVFVSQGFNNELVNVAIPKFKIKSTIPFVEILQNLGVESVFDPQRADLSGIAGKPGDLVISDVLQKTYIDVTEEGVEAAASTYVGISFTSALINEAEPKNFVADHPFIFYIKIKNFVVFTGRVVDPSH